MHPGELIGGVLRELSYEILAGQTIVRAADRLDLIGVMERTQRKRHAYDRPGVFYGRQIALIRAHGDPLIVEIFDEGDAAAAAIIAEDLVGLGFQVRVDLKKSGKKRSREIRFA